MKKFKSLLSQMAKVAITASIAVVVSMIIYILWQIHQHKELVKITQSELKNMAEKVWQAKSGNFTNAVRDNSAWDEVVNFINRDYERSDSAWLEDNFGYMTNMYSAAMIRMYDSIGIKKYTKISEKYQGFNFFPFSFYNFTECFKDTGLVNFYIYNKGRLMEYFCATITPSSDNFHKRKPKGYMLVAREINNELLEDFRISLGAIYTGISTNENDTNAQKFAENGFNIIISKDLENFAQIREARMNTVFENSVEANFAKMIPVFGILVFMCFLAMGGLVLFLRNKVMRPLKKISHSLAESKPDEIISLKDNPDELGQVAEMLEEFYIQKEMVQTQNETLKEQRAEILSINEDLQNQKNELAAANKEITESISYAGRIQKSVVGTRDDVAKVFPDCMVYYKPKHIISGDWYHVGVQKGKEILVEADCTGHGVPGSLLSMMGISALKDIINNMEILGEELQPATILNRMRTVIKNTLAQNSDDGFSVSDGMDMTVGIIDSTTMIMKFASANQSAIIIRGEESIRLKGDHMPIGNYMHEEDFQNFDVQLKSGDALYFMSDGIKDQTNPDKEKYKVRRLVAFLIENNHLPMVEIGKKLEETIEAWRANSEQIDDMTIVGVRI